MKKQNEKRDSVWLIWKKMKDEEKFFFRVAETKNLEI